MHRKSFKTFSHYNSSNFITDPFKKKINIVLIISLNSIKNSSRVTTKPAKSEGNNQIHKVASIVFLIILSEFWENEKNRKAA